MRILTLFFNNTKYDEHEISIKQKFDFLNYTKLLGRKKNETIVFIFYTIQYRSKWLREKQGKIFHGTS